jgi:hypothetical protein
MNFFFQLKKNHIEFIGSRFFDGFFKNIYIIELWS